MQELTTLTPFIIFLIAAWTWTLPWKVVALWKAARKEQKVWFIVLFIVNTLAILEILYIFVFSKQKTDNLKNY